MDCRYFRDLISPYLDGMLHKDEVELFEEHLGGCQECRQEVDKYRRMIGTITQLEEEELPEGFRERLHKKLIEESTGSDSGFVEVKPKNSLKWIRWASIAAAAFVILFSIRALDLVNFRSMDFYRQPAQEEAKTSDSGSDGVGIKSMDQPEAGNIEPEAEKKISVQFSEDKSSVQKLDENEEKQEKSDDYKGESVVEKGEDQVAAKGMPEEVPDKQRNASVALEVADEFGGTILSDKVKVTVQDVCITTNTLKEIALRNDILVLDSQQDGIIVQVDTPEQRKVLYEELVRLGKVEDVGEKKDSNKVNIIIVRKQ